MRRCSGTLLIVVLMFGCTKPPKVVAWDEEVVLNTGESITLHREETYEYGGEPGNPLKNGWTGKRWGTAKFTWRGREYVFNEHSAPMLLAISPEGQPVFAMDAQTGAWSDINNFPCTTPYYVQFVPDESGRRWTWPKTVAPWLYGLRMNFLQDLPTPDSPARRYSAAEVRSINEGLKLPLHQQAIDPTFSPSDCKGTRPKA